MAAWGKEVMDKDCTLIPVKIIRTACHGGKPYEAEGELSIRKDKNTIYVVLTKGGATGFENLSFPMNRFEVFEWCACLGRKGEYDKVVIPKEEMERAYREAGII